jgi:hypothetical protein
MPLVGFEPMIAAGKQPQTYALDYAATETSIRCQIYCNKIHLCTIHKCKSRFFNTFYILSS